MLKEFKPALAFLGKFLGIYFLGNILYGLFIEACGNRPDVITTAVTRQAGAILSWTGSVIEVTPAAHSPVVALGENHRAVLTIYEGCNGVNVMIIFVAFLVAFGGPLRKMAWFLPAGLLIIHLCNLLRIFLLYFTALHYERYFYFVHKYFFTAVLYLVIFALWTIWVIRFNVKQREVIDSSSQENN